MLNTLLHAFADAAIPPTSAATTPDQPGQLEQVYRYLPFIGIPVLLYLIMIRPMQKEKKQREALLNQIKKNDDVILSSGIYGSVVGVSEDKDEITVKIADNTRIRVLKSSIARNLTNEEALKVKQPTAATVAAKKEGTA